MIDIDFSSVNQQYLIQARDITRHDPQIAATRLGISPELARLLSKITPEDISKIVVIKSPLMMPRPKTWWWKRFLEALHEGRDEEIDAVLEHANLIITDNQ